MIRKGTASNAMQMTEVLQAAKKPKTFATQKYQLIPDKIVHSSVYKKVPKE